MKLRTSGGFNGVNTGSNLSDDWGAMAVF